MVRWLYDGQHQQQAEEQDDRAQNAQADQGTLLACLVIADVVELAEDEAGDQTQQRQEEGQDRVPLAAGIVVCLNQLLYPQFSQVYG